MLSWGQCATSGLTQAGHLPVAPRAASALAAAPRAPPHASSHTHARIVRRGRHSRASRASRRGPPRASARTAPASAQRRGHGADRKDTKKIQLMRYETRERRLASLPSAHLSLPLRSRRLSTWIHTNIFKVQAVDAGWHLSSKAPATKRSIISSAFEGASCGTRCPAPPTVRCVSPPQLR